MEGGGGSLGSTTGNTAGKSSGGKQRWKGEGLVALRDEGGGHCTRLAMQVSET